MITIGIPTLNRYDLLLDALKSMEVGSIKPDKYIIIDNGGHFEYNDFYTALGDRLQVITPAINLGVAASWNRICKESEDIRVICNDDLKFFPDTLKNLVDNFSERDVKFPGGVPSANAFSCFMIPNKVLKIVGYFDEDISPGYGYFEDNDYFRRMILKGISLLGVGDCRIIHTGSSTLKALNEEAKKLHHMKFRIAQDNYKKKWGGLPGSETFLLEYNKEEKQIGDQMKINILSSTPKKTSAVEEMVKNLFSNAMVVVKKKFTEEEQKDSYLLDSDAVFDKAKKTMARRIAENMDVGISESVLESF